MAATIPPPKLSFRIKNSGYTPNVKEGHHVPAHAEATRSAKPWSSDIIDSDQGSHFIS